MNNELVKSNVPKLTIFVRKNRQSDNIGTHSSLHYHDELELIPIYEGEFHCVVEGEDLLAKAGDVIFINSRVPHHTYATVPQRTGLLQFRESDFLDGEMLKIIMYSVKFQSRSDSPAKILHIPELFDAVDSVLEESERRCNAYDFYIRSGIYRILGCLYREEILKGAEQIYYSKEIQKIQSALLYINEHYSEDLGLEDMSRMLGFDTSYFCRIFKAATGATFTEYLRFVRICKAESLLAKSTYSILEISEMVGFSSASYFNRVFKKYKNCSPRHYRIAKYIAISKGENEG